MGLLFGIFLGLEHIPSVQSVNERAWNKQPYFDVVIHYSCSVLQSKYLNLASWTKQIVW